LERLTDARGNARCYAAVRKQNRINPVPAEARDVFIMEAKRMCPKAVDEMVLEYIRKIKKYWNW
jgi:hypothetical protein